MTLYLAFVLLPLITLTQSLHDKALPDPQHYRELLGKRVVLEGVAWDSVPGWRGRVQIPSGEQVFIVDGARRPWERRRSRMTIDGKMVRVVGVLTFEMGNYRKPTFTPIAGITIAQPAFLRNYFSIQMESYEVIEQAQLGQPVLLPGQ